MVVRNNTVITDEYLYLHGASVVVGNKCAILVGESGVGKTTIASFIDMQPDGMALGDDLVAINSRNNTATAIGSKMKIRQKSLAFLPRRTDSYHFSNITKRYEHHIIGNEKPRDVSLIAVLRRDEQQVINSRIHNPIDVLLRNTYLPYQLQSNIRSCLSIIQTIPVFSLCVGDLFSAYDEIKNMLNSGG